jgi:hypothetical protein
MPCDTSDEAGVSGGGVSVVELCWLVTSSGSSLHHGSFTGDVDNEVSGEGRTDCGIESVLSVPGIFTRMSAPRCRRCCAATGMPEGTGSPKNDDDCRRLLGLEV